jgi:hypothetical protein
MEYRQRIWTCNSIRGYRWSSYKFSFSKPPEPIYYRFTFFVCILYLLILLTVHIVCLYSISPDPLTSSHSLYVFYISWSYYRFTFSFCILYILILFISWSYYSECEPVIGSRDMEQRHRIITCKGIRRYRFQTQFEPIIGSGDIEHIQRMEPITCSHSLYVYHIYWSYYRFTFSVCILYLLIQLPLYILCLYSISDQKI